MAVHLTDLRQMMPRVDISLSVTDWQPLISDSALALALIEAEGSPSLYFHRTGSAFHGLWATYKPYLKGPITLTIILMVLLLTSVVRDIHLLGQRVDRNNGEIASIIQSAFPDVSRISDRPADQMRSKMAEFKKNLVDPTHAGSQPRIIDILNQISRLVPHEADVMLNRLVVGGDGITVAGETIDFNTVDDIKNRLEKSDLFSKVTIAAANMDKSGQTVRFRLKIDL